MIDLQHPKRSEKSGRKTIYIYLCGKCKQELRIVANSFRGSTPVPGIGGVLCPCEEGGG